MYDELTAGYHVDPDELLNGACFSVDYDEMVVVRDIEFFSLCEHHLLPFIGHAHVGYRRVAVWSAFRRSRGSSTCTRSGSSSRNGSRSRWPSS